MVHSHFNLKFRVVWSHRLNGMVWTIISLSHTKRHVICEYMWVMHAILNVLKWTWRLKWLHYGVNVFFTLDVACFRSLFSTRFRNEMHDHFGDESMGASHMIAAVWWQFLISLGFSVWTHFIDGVFVFVHNCVGPKAFMVYKEISAVHQGNEVQTNKMGASYSFFSLMGVCLIHV